MKALVSRGLLMKAYMHINTAHTYTMTAACVLAYNAGPGSVDGLEHTLRLAAYVLMTCVCVGWSVAAY